MSRVTYSDGDCFPITGVGKLVAVGTMIVGILEFAMAVSCLGSNFVKTYELYEEDLKQLDAMDRDNDGVVDEDELRQWLLDKKKEGMLRKDIETNVSALMAK